MASRVCTISFYTHLRCRTVAYSPRAVLWPYRRAYATATAATNRSRHAPSTSTERAAPKAGASKTAASSKSQVLSEKEQMEQLEKILTFSQLMPTADVWGQKVETLEEAHDILPKEDVMIPYSIFSSLNRNIWSLFWKNRLNDLKNLTSMVALARNNAIPGVNTGADRFFKKLFKWPVYMFGTQSTNSTSWLAPMRKLALDAYTQLNVAMARNDLKEIKRLTMDSFLANALAAQKKRTSAHTYVWRLHREVNPTRIVSLRVTEGYLSPEEPKFGNRLMVHALAKFDTEQSLEIYDRRGNALHKPAASAIETKDDHVPAERQRVVQYLVLEKRMWYDGPWMIRDEVWEINTKKD